jgi:hypothetical protein
MFGEFGGTVKIKECASQLHLVLHVSAKVVVIQGKDCYNH